MTFSFRFAWAVALCMTVLCCLYNPDLVHAFTNSDKYASVIMNVNNGKTIRARNANLERYPASLTKVMTLYVLFDEIKKGRLSLNKTIVVSKKAASQPRSNLNMKAGDKISVKEAILAITVKSANDVAVAVAEKVAGSEARFVAMMNEKARSLKMHKTIFVNASGLPNKKQVTTARDMALLAVSMQKKHREFYHLFSRTSFKFGNRIVKGHNHVVRNHKWVDGMKTGYINDSGFNIITTAKRPEGRLVAVVMGGDTAANRDQHTVNLLKSAYSDIRPLSKVKPLNAVQKKSVQQVSKGKLINAVQKKSVQQVSNGQFPKTAKKQGRISNSSVKQDVFAYATLQKASYTKNAVSAKAAKSEEQKGVSKTSTKSIKSGATLQKASYTKNAVSAAKKQGRISNSSVKQDVFAYATLPKASYTAPKRELSTKLQKSNKVHTSLRR